MKALVSISFSVFGVIAIAIGLAIFLAGPHATASFFGDLVLNMTGRPGYHGGLEDPNTGSEMRFFSVFWIAYGALLLQKSRDVLKNRTALLLLTGLFFAGGVGRMLAHATSGTPDPLFSALGWVELALPFVLAAMLLSTRKLQ